jgi:opacity protein-like surface antigen
MTFMQKLIVVSAMFALLGGCAAKADLSNAVQPEDRVEYSGQEPPTSVRAGVVWEGKVGSHYIQWKTDDLILRDLRTENTFRAADLIEREIKRRSEAILSQSPETSGQTLRYIVGIRIMSVLGSLVSFQFDFVSVGLGTGSSIERSWVTFDLSSADAIKNIRDHLTNCIDFDAPCDAKAAGVDLRNYWTADEVYSGILNSPDLPEKWRNELRGRSTNLTDFLANRPVIGDSDGLFEYLREESFYGYVFDRIDNDNLIVLMRKFRLETREYSTYSMAVPLPMNQTVKRYLDAQSTSLHRNGFDKYGKIDSKVSLDVDL